MKHFAVLAVTVASAYAAEWMDFQVQQNSSTYTKHIRSQPFSSASVSSD